MLQQNHVFEYTKKFKLESNKTIDGFHLAYTTWGNLNKLKNNVVWIFHALTANSDPAEWWPGLVGEKKLFDPKKDFIICVNIPGSCYGSTSALDKKEYYHNFPWFTIKDMVAAYQQLKKHLGITKIHIGIGGSMGGQQLLEWAITEPNLFEYIFPIACNAVHSPWAIAFNTSQRMCIEGDTTWLKKTKSAGINGMKAARSVALLSYRNYNTYNKAQQEETNNIFSNFKSDSYQRYQGDKLSKRFNAFSYYFLSMSMDSHNVGRGRLSIQKALQKITAKTLVIGIQSDILFPPNEQKTIADNIPNAKLRIIDSFYGHDGFLLEYTALEKCITQFLLKNK